MAMRRAHRPEGRDPTTLVRTAGIVVLQQPDPTAEGPRAPSTVPLADRACLIGRAYVYGLGAGGKAGVAKAIDILQNELSVAMALTGTTRVADIGPQVVFGGTGTAPTRKRKG